MQDSVKKRLDGRSGLQERQDRRRGEERRRRLTGTVDGFGDRMTALTVARSTDGVKSVIDELKIKKELAITESEKERAMLDVTGTIALERTLELDLPPAVRALLGPRLSSPRLPPGRRASDRIPRRAILAETIDD